MADIRLDLGFLDHVKTRRLRARCKADGVLALLRLWCYAAQCAADGLLKDMSPEEVEGVAGWRGRRGTLFSGLCALGWLDETPGGYYLHDWHEWQAWAMHAPKRRARARHAASMRWAMRDACPEQCPEECSEHACSNAPSPAPPPPPPPFPPPSPPPIGKKPSRRGAGGVPFDEKQDQSDRLTTDEVFDVWNDTAAEYGLPRILAGRAKLIPKVRAMLKDLGEFGTESVLGVAFDLFAAQEIVQKKRYGLGNFLPNYAKYTPEAIERKVNGGA